MNIKTQKTLIATIVSATFLFSLPAVANDCEVSGKYSVRILDNINVPACTVSDGNTGGEDESNNPDNPDGGENGDDDDQEVDEFKGCDGEGIQIVDNTFDGTTLFSVNREQLDNLIAGENYCVVNEELESDFLIDSFSGNLIDVSQIDSFMDLFAHYDFTINNDAQLISNWNMSNATQMNFMFWFANGDLDLSKWRFNENEEINMAGMFLEHKGNLNLSNWSFSPTQPVFMNSMFRNQAGTVTGLGDWDMENQMNLGRMFEGKKSYNNNHFPQDILRDIARWKLSNATELYQMFAKISFTAPGVYRVELDLSNLPNISNIFWGADVKNLDITSLNLCPYERTINYYEHDLLLDAINTDSRSFKSLDFENMCDRHCGSNIFNSNNIETDDYGRPIIQDAKNIYNNDISSERVLKNMVWEGSSLCLTNDNGVVIKKITSYGDDFINTSRVRDFSRLFEKNDVKHSISGWDTSSAHFMDSMFKDSENFNQDLSRWNVERVVGFDDFDLGAINWVDEHKPPFVSEDDKDFVCEDGHGGHILNNSPYVDSDDKWLVDEYGLKDLLNGVPYCVRGNVIDSYSDELINTEWVTNMAGLFANRAVEYSISGWDVSNVTDMSNMFANSQDFNQDISGWDVSNVIDMSGMFDGASSFNQSLNNWNVSNVQNMAYMFFDAANFNQSLNNWNVSNVSDMSGMFYGASNFNQSLSSWNVSNVYSMSSMFAATDSFNHPLENWNVSNVVDMSYMFYGAKSFNQPLSNWNVSNVSTMEAMFRDTSVFNGLISGWDVTNVQNMDYMFNNAKGFTNQLLSKYAGWCVSHIPDEPYMFSEGASKWLPALQPKWGEYCGD